MRVLVYGAGVIGSYLTHVLCTAGNDVTMMARGRWKQVLEENGLQIRHHLQRRDTLDRPKVIGSVEEAETYDAVFAVMPSDKMRQILEPLAQIDTPLVVLVGNNTDPEGMERIVLERSSRPKKVLFGFQGTAGKRDWEHGRAICERLGRGSMDIGGLHALPDADTMRTLEALFVGTGYRLSRQPDMAAFLLCHQALVLPIGFLAYACGTDLRRSDKAQRKLMWLATREAYAMLAAQGIPILPEGDEKSFDPGIAGLFMRAMYLGMTKIHTAGDLIACEHCRNAYEEMRALDESFAKVIARAPQIPMPHWHALKAQMPTWDEIEGQYSRK